MSIDAAAVRSMDPARPVPRALRRCGTRLDHAGGTRAAGGRRALGVGLLALVAWGGCETPFAGWPAPGREPPVIPDADTPFTEPRSVTPAPSVHPASPVGTPVDLSILHVKVPRASAGAMENVWNHLREDALPADVTLRMHRNGIRIGVGRTQDWEAVKAVIDGIADAQVNQAQPVRLPERIPLDLELDLEPGDQTIFFIGADGVLTGDTWPRSRNVFRVVHTVDPRHPERVYLGLLPQVRRELSGLRWVRTAAGLTQVPRYEGRSFGWVSCTLALEAREFALIAPSENADIPGLVGRAFLVESSEDQDLISYIFIQPTVVPVAAPQ